MEEPEFLKKICVNPDDDEPRLVFADWLEEHDQPGFATFIRGQIELAQMDEADPRYSALLAEVRRTGMFTEPRRKPFVDHVPDARVVMFRRGLIGGVQLSEEQFLRHPTETWKQVPFEQLAIDLWRKQPPSKDELLQRLELQKVKTLCLSEGTPDRILSLLYHCPHLKDLKALAIKLEYAHRESERYAAYELGLKAPLPMPKLNSLRVRESAIPVRWEPFVKACPTPLKRLRLDCYSENIDVDRTRVDWLHEGNYTSQLIDEIITGTWYDYHETELEREFVIDAFPSFQKATESTIERLTTRSDEASRFAGQSWGNIRHLHLVEHNETQAYISPLSHKVGFDNIETLKVGGWVSPKQAAEFASGQHTKSLRRLEFYCCSNEFLDGAYCQNLLGLMWAGSGQDSNGEALVGDYDYYDGGSVVPRLTKEDLAKLAATPFPELRTLCLSGIEKWEHLGPFLASKNFPNLCTLILGVKGRIRGWMDALAQAPNMPNLSLVQSGNYWVLKDGQAFPVLRGISPLDSDWWSALGTKYWDV